MKVLATIVNHITGREVRRLLSDKPTRPQPKPREYRSFFQDNENFDQLDCQCIELLTNEGFLSGDNRLRYEN